MSNMSYCRWQNTDGDLADVVDDLERRIDGHGEDEDGDPMEPLSEHETYAAISLLGRATALVSKIMEEMEVDSIDDVTQTKIREMIARLQKESLEAMEKRAIEEGE